MVSTYLAWDYMIDVHLTFICSTYLAEATITFEHAFTLFAVTPTVQLI
jgi:hypothetical protein